MSGTTFDDDVASEREFEERLAVQRRRRAERFSPKTRIWLVLPPAWTDELAMACSFPYHNRSPEEFVREAVKADLCVFQEMPSDTGESSVLRFWVPDEARVWLLRDLREDERTRRSLLEEALELGRLIQKAAAAGVPVAPLVHCWAKLAALGTRDAAPELINTITGLVERGETGEAQTWVAAAKHLAQTFGGPLESAVRVGDNLIEREYRRIQDERYLNRFKPIPEQIDAFQRLMKTASGDGADTQRDAPWALHYIGDGGVGKTMLLRHLTGRLLVEDKERSKPFSRIDFDYLSPDYPMRRPGQLLQELAAGLRAQLTAPEQYSAYASFQSIALELHEALSEEPAPEEPLANIRRTEFGRMLVAFNDFLLTLPQPVVLFLDTCEELAKVQTAGGRMPTVEATFEILERVHDKAPQARVVLAGRRLLAKAGHDWRVSPGELADARKFLPERKDYLLLHVIGGFDQVEAEEYLSENEGLRLAEDLRRAVLDKSVDGGRVSHIHYQPPRPAAPEDRYNPFYLSLYAQWIKEDPRVGAGDISGGKVDPYVEIRIVNRVNERMREVLPAAVLLRRFNKEMLAEALASPDRLDEVYQQLSGQEWINYQWDEELQTNFLEVDRNLHGRLLEYYERSKDSYLLDRAREKIGPGLALLVRQRPTRQLTVEHLDAVLRLLPVKEAAEVWGDYELRIAEDGTWGRALRVTERILSQEGAVKSEVHPLRAAVLATRAAATLHIMPELSLEQLWTEVWRTAPQHPDPEVGKWLGRRAEAGVAVSLGPQRLLAAFAMTEGTFNPGYLAPPLPALTSPTRTLLEDLLEMGGEVVEELRAGAPEGAARKRMEQLCASFCAVQEACVEMVDLFRADAESYTSPPSLDEQLKHIHLYLKEFEKTLDAFLLAGQDIELAAFSVGLKGRTDAIGGNWGRAASQLNDAADTAAVAKEDEQNLQRRLDWRAPASARDRLRLERLRCIPPGLAKRPPWETILKWQNEAAGRLGNIDSERLVSFIIQLRLAEGLVPEEELQELLSREKYDPNRQPWRAAHGAAPPLLCSLALGWLARGDGARGLALATNRIEEATGTREDQPTVRAAEAVKLHIIRRLRLPRRGADVINRLARSKDPRDVLAIRELIAVNGSFNPDAVLQPSDASPSSIIHAWWRSQTTLTREAAGFAVERLNKLAGRRLREAAELKTIYYSLDADLLHLAQDWQEAMRIARHFKISGLLPELELFIVNSDWSDRYPTRTEDALRLEFRRIARNDHNDHKDSLEKFVEKVGKRRCAELALEEGELLALRLPDEAVWLLSAATRLFKECGDHGGAVIAATRTLIARFHSHNESARTGLNLKSMGEVWAHYERLSSADSTLPNRSELQDIRDNPTAENLARLNHPSWQGWLHRLISVWAELADLSETSRRGGRQWRNLLERVYGRRLPIELMLSPDELERRETTAPALPLFLRILLRYWLKAAVFPFLIFVLLFIGGVINPDGFVNIFADNEWAGQLSFLALALMGVVAYARWVKKGLTPFQAVTYLGAATVIFAAVVALIFFFPSLFTKIDVNKLSIVIPIIMVGAVFLWALARRMRELLEALWVAVSDTSLQILPGEGEDELKSEMFDSRSVRMIFRRSYFTSIFLPIKRIEDVYEGAGSVAGLAPYREAMKTMPLEVSNELFRLNGLLQKSISPRLRIALDVEPSLAHYPWEAALSQAAAGEDESLPRIHFWRAGEPFAGKSSTRYEKKIYVVVSRTWEMMARHGWARLSGMKINTGITPMPGQPGTLRLLHLIGTPTKVSAGLRLKVSDSATSDAEGRDTQVTQAGGSAAAAMDDGVRYFGTEDLPLEQSALVVVQGEPSEFSERQQTQREQTARLRAYAADLFAAGAPRVVLLPSLPEAVAEKVLHQLGADLRAGDQPIVLFLQTIERMRSIILQGLAGRPVAGDPAAEARLELALDICVFTRDASSLSQTSKDKPR